jgi:hypothetical protein
LTQVSWGSLVGRKGRRYVVEPVTPLPIQPQLFQPFQDEMRLCHHCERLGTLRWGPELPEPDFEFANYQRYDLHPSIKHFSKLLDLAKSSAECPLCKLFLELFIEAHGLKVLEDLFDKGRNLEIWISRSYSDDFNSMWLEIRKWNPFQSLNSSPLGICLETGKLLSQK